MEVFRQELQQLERGVAQWAPTLDSYFSLESLKDKVIAMWRDELIHPRTFWRWLKDCKSDV